MKKNANAEKFDCNNCPVDKNGLCDEHYSCVRGVWDAAQENKGGTEMMRSGIKTCCNKHIQIAYIGDPLTDYGFGCPLCEAIESAIKFKAALESKGETEKKESAPCSCQAPTDYQTVHRTRCTKCGSVWLA